MELMPRITRAQSMDVLSSQANLAGYKAVIDAASMLEQAVPMIQRGEYSLALLRLNTESPRSSVPQQARIISAYALLIAGEKLGAFPTAF